MDDYKNLALYPDAIEMDIDEILKTLSYYHFVTLLDKPWSSIIQYKCSCPEFYKCGACEHAILTSMMVDRSIEVPLIHCTRKPEPVAKTTIHGAVLAGSSSDSEECEDGEAEFMSGRQTMKVPPPPPPCFHPRHVPVPIPDHHNMLRAMCK